MDDGDRQDAAGVERRWFVVRGRVQGVAFRASAAQQARGLGCTGRIANAADGSVRGEVQGRVDVVEHFVAWLHDGPPMARVDSVEAQTVATVDGESSFEIRR